MINFVSHDAWWLPTQLFTSFVHHSSRLWMCFEVIWLQNPRQNVKWSQIWLSADSDRYNVYCELCSVEMISWVSSTCNFFFAFSLFSWFSSDFPLTFSHLLTVALLLWPIKGKRSSSLHIYQIGWYTFQIKKHSIKLSRSVAVVQVGLITVPKPWVFPNQVGLVKRPVREPVVSIATAIVREMKPV